MGGTRREQQEPSRDSYGMYVCMNVWVESLSMWMHASPPATAGIRRVRKTSADSYGIMYVCECMCECLYMWIHARLPRTGRPLEVMMGGVGTHVCVNVCICECMQLRLPCQESEECDRHLAESCVVGVCMYACKCVCVWINVHTQASKHTHIHTHADLTTYTYFSTTKTIKFVLLQQAMHVWLQQAIHTSSKNSHIYELFHRHHYFLYIRTKHAHRQRKKRINALYQLDALTWSQQWAG